MGPPAMEGLVTHHAPGTRRNGGGLMSQVPHGQLTGQPGHGNRQTGQWLGQEMVGTARFELATPRPPGECATGLRYAPTFLDQAGQSQP